MIHCYSDKYTYSFYKKPIYKILDILDLKIVKKLLVLNVFGSKKLRNYVFYVFIKWNKLMYKHIFICSLITISSQYLSNQLIDS